jgi:acetylornithine deacetylase/succinyl-diaminopimelate desuccinylase-like protein
MDLAAKVNAICADPAYQEELISLLLDMTAVETTPNPDVAIMRDREAQVFQRIRTYLKDCLPGQSRFEDRAVSPEIQHHPAYSLLHFTKTESRPDGLPSEEVYDGRFNLLHCIDGEPSGGGRNMAFNAHIDVVLPYFPPRRNGEKLFGRGIVDDKGNIAAICGALKIVDALVRGGDVQLKNKITSMFVVEEETGGNGSLSLALDRELKKRYDSILVMDVCSNRIHPANRGAVWFMADSAWKNGNAPRNASLLEATAYGVLAMQREGEAIKEESVHPLFPHRPVQTCNGILGPFGNHPSGICGLVVFTVNGVREGEMEAAVRGAIDAGLAEYIETYGDKTQVTDPATGAKKVDHHLDIERTGEATLRVAVHGSTGHMGAILENDAAITKWAYLMRAMIDLRREREWVLCFELEDFDSSERLVLEGGQGFLPTHPIEAVQERMAASFDRGVKGYLAQAGTPADAIEFDVTYNKLHNAAFDGDADSPSMKNALAAGLAVGMIEPDMPVRGWDVSCDSRLFASEYPEMPVITSGVGDLAAAHSDDEHLFLPDLWKATAFCALYLLHETGSAERTVP